ncbi:hypothetical protein TNCV_4362111 [Trichonephila clavipes]|nr:hypothetical protein TNCV_4362111 [Trichonephila clavipes]
MNTNCNTNSELVDINFIYNLASGNGLVVRLYGERCQKMRQLNHQTFASVHYNLAEHGSFREMIDETPVNSKMDLVAGMSIAAATIRETSGIAEYVRQSMFRRCRACRHANGSNFK